MPLLCQLQTNHIITCRPENKIHNLPRSSKTWWPTERSILFKRNIQATRAAWASFWDVESKSGQTKLLESVPSHKNNPCSSGHASLRTNKGRKDILSTLYRLGPEKLLTQDRCKRWVHEGRGRERLLLTEIRDLCLLVLCPQSPSIKFHINKIIQLLSISYIVPDPKTMWFSSLNQKSKFHIFSLKDIHLIYRVSKKN